ncbi:hypothetical protein QBC33DRAFT_250100 [Phialemonium atrogriseum]|uniref:Uncharacterized protein n=1 Tax=Phialemonium atrogriseum TaxID=1093897 RepID=A0AAJ0FJH6_9PEZI|nr:uncharacterized protein QBC33DRAFT_250100 [Phialemonium atrogriseum]KAK1763125.1 hypothetical protein QBC33DRAFT_250100 [Phialemonium atrogriseum]
MVLGKSIDCLNETQAWRENPADPDLVGIGVILSFILTAFAAVSTLALAFVNHGIPEEQYNCVDQKIISRLDSWLGHTTRALKKGPRKTVYQTFILALSDQTLVIGIALLITIYAQICDITAFTFQMANDLVFFCSTAYLATLTALRMHFKHNKWQKRLRVSLMAFHLVFLLSSTFIQYLTWTHDPGTLEVCVIDDYEDELGSTILDWLALVLFMVWCYHESLTADLRSDRLYGEEEHRYPLALSLEARFSRDPHFKDDLEAYVHEEKLRRLGKWQNLQMLLRGTPSGYPKPLYKFFKMFQIAGPDIWKEVASSLFTDVLTTVIWFGLAILYLVRHLQFEEVDLSPLMEWKFGQAIPAILLIVYAINAVESRNSVAHDTSITRGTAQEDAATQLSVQPSNDLVHNSSAGAERLASQQEALEPAVQEQNLPQDEATGYSQGNPASEPQQMVRRRTAQLQEASTASATATAQSHTSSPTQRRVSTLEMEDGRESDAQDLPDVDLVELVMKKSRGCGTIYVLIFLALIIGFTAFLFLSFTIAVIVGGEIYTLGKLFKNMQAVMGVRRVRKERRLQREAARLRIPNSYR